MFSSVTSGPYSRPPSARCGFLKRKVIKEGDQVDAAPSLGCVTLPKLLHLSVPDILLYLIGMILLVHILWGYLAQHLSELLPRKKVGGIPYMVRVIIRS